MKTARKSSEKLMYYLSKMAQEIPKGFSPEGRRSVLEVVKPLKKERGDC